MAGENTDILAKQISEAIFEKPVAINFEKAKEG